MLFVFWSLERLQSKSAAATKGQDDGGWSSVREAPAWPAAAHYRSYNSSLMHAGNYVHLAPVCYNMLAAFWAASLAHSLVGCHHLVTVRSSWSSDRACQPVCTRPQPILLYYWTESESRLKSSYANDNSKLKSFIMLIQGLLLFHDIYKIFMFPRGWTHRLDS